MRTSRISFLFLAALTVAGCKSTSAACCDACENCQAVVERVARDNPAVTRLTMHCTPANATMPMACASTSAAKRGTASDPEDVRAMQTGQPVVMEEGSALDVTVPVLADGGRYKGAVGVTLKPEGMSREQTIERAKSIAMAVEAGAKTAGPCTCGTAK
jgi:hypothetical protein